MSFLSGVGAVLEKITNHIQGREERRRNEIDSLENERRELLEKEFTAKSAMRLQHINDRLSVLKRQAANSA